MPNSTDRSGESPKALAGLSYGPDWIGLDRREMAARRKVQIQREDAARQREAERIEDEVQQLTDFNERLLADPAEDLRTPRTPSRIEDAGATPISKPLEMSRPTALLDRIYIENLKALAGEHRVQLAPLTLIYGPNSAGKSTILRGLKLFMNAVNVGRRDALQVWRKAFENSVALRNLLTWETPDPDDPERVHWRRQLRLGVDFRTGDGEVARAELEFAPNPIGPVDYLTSGLGMLGEADLSRKIIGLEDPDPFDPEFDPARAFGTESLVPYEVREKRPGGDWTSEIKVADAELFAHPSTALKSDLFAMAYLLRYLGPQRGQPGAAYVPLEGPFNRKFPPFELVNYGQWGIADFRGYEVLNQMMSQLEVPYEFEPRLTAEGLRLGEVAGDSAAIELAREWDLKDLRSGALVSLDEVGYGVGQLLPVIDACVHSRHQLICVEEPELHLHPRLQSRLGNLFATSITAFRNQVILETHSESILLRVRRLIRRGKLLPDEVAVLYVDNNTENGASVRRIRLGAQGELLDPWPTGFYDDRLEDVLGGWE
ncbi:AAA family ATPase [Micropruina sonneratiae]|uniref:AAA family ATPase n=1 Tax=Micropruina sonneratiae TaxID=2986940 RepID=UPI002226CC39|nr:AAA family ATPase [Micropruina sp. KQZ13P-5]MCW3159472.1 AAA family ATPase [Micropruina sp. KQZ13P-5]